MASNPCPEAPELLALVMGNPVPASVRRPVDECGPCRLRIDRLRAELSAVRDVAGEMPDAAGGPEASAAAGAATASLASTTESSEDDLEVPEATEPLPR